MSSSNDTMSRPSGDDVGDSSERLSVLGHIAAAVAHEVNNWLFVIRGFSELAQMEVGAGHPASPKLDRIQEAADRCELLNRMILESAHPSGDGVVLIQIHPIVKEALKLVRSACAGELPVSQAVDAEGPVVAVDPVRLFPAVKTVIELAAGERATPPGYLRVTLDGESPTPDAEPTRVVLSVGWVKADRADTDVWRRLKEAADSSTTHSPGGDDPVGVAAAVFAAFGGGLRFAADGALGSCWRLSLPAATATGPRT